MALYTQKAIRQTFLKMLEEMPLDKITVSALARRCEISVNTVYYHYHDIYDLLDAELSSELCPLLNGRCEDWKKNLAALLHRMQTHPAIVFHVSSSLSRERMERYVFQSSNDLFERLIAFYLPSHGLPEDEKKAMADFCRYAFLGFLLRFIWNRMEDEVDKSVDLLESVMERLIRGSVGVMKG